MEIGFNCWRCKSRKVAWVSKEIFMMNNGYVAYQASTKFYSQFQILWIKRDPIFDIKPIRRILAIRYQPNVVQPGGKFFQAP